MARGFLVGQPYVLVTKVCVASGVQTCESLFAGASRLRQNNSGPIRQPFDLLLLVKRAREVIRCSIPVVLVTHIYGATASCVCVLLLCLKKYIAEATVVRTGR